MHNKHTNISWDIFTSYSNEEKCTSKCNVTKITIPNQGEKIIVVVGRIVVEGFEQLTLHTNSKEVDPGTSLSPPP